MSGQVFPLRGIAGVGGVHHAALHGAVPPDPGHHDPHQLIVSPAPGATPSSTGPRPAPEPSTPARPPPATPQTSSPSSPPATAPCWAARPAATPGTPGRCPDRPSRTPATRCPARGAQRPARISPVTGQQPPGPRSKAGTAPTAEQDDLHDPTSASNPAPGCPDSAIWTSSRSLGRTAPMSARVAAARSSPFSARHSEQVQQGCARPPAGRAEPGRWQAGWRGSEEAGPKPDRAGGSRGQPSLPGACPSWPCSSRPCDRPRVIGYPACSPDSAARPATAAPRPRRASRGQGAWPRATRRRIRPSRSAR